MIKADEINEFFRLNLLSSTLSFECLDLVNSGFENSLTYLDDIKFIDQLNTNTNIKGVFTTYELNSLIHEKMITIIVDDPRYYFFSFFNYLARKNKVFFDSEIDSSTTIYPNVYIADKNVKIGANTIIYPNVTILEDVEIGENTIIRSGSVIGTEGFEHKRTSKGILSVYHEGKVIIGNNVEIGANNSISKGFMQKDTIIGDDTKTDNLVHIAHASQIGKRCFLPACVMIAGSTIIGNDVWIGPNSSISSGLKISNNAFITIGSVVTKDVGSFEKVTGNFAIPHDKFLEHLKRKLK